jgi:glucose/arabinose dehydrogenase
MGTLRATALLRVRLDGERVVAEEFMLRGDLSRVRTVKVGPDGYVYLLTDVASGAILRLEPAAE